MAIAQRNANQMKPSSKSSKLRIITVAALLIVAALTGMVIYKQHQKNEAIANERAQYAQAEKDLDALSAQIIAKFGQPDDQNNNNKCGYTSSELGTGMLYCDTSQYLYYPVSNSDMALRMTVEVRELGGVFSNLERNDGLPSLASTSFNTSRLECSSGLSLHSDSDKLESLGYVSLKLNSPGLGFLIELSCSAQHPRAVYYPIKGP